MNIAVIVTSLLTMLPAMNHSQPDDVVSIDNDQVETTDNVSSTLLTKARHLKTTIKPGYGEFYRRSAWASLDENQPATALSTLEELSQSYETLFDQWDSYRIAGRIYSSMENHEQAAA